MPLFSPTPPFFAFFLMSLRWRTPVWFGISEELCAAFPFHTTRREQKMWDEISFLLLVSRFVTTYHLFAFIYHTYIYTGGFLLALSRDLLAVIVSCLLLVDVQCW